MKYENTLRSLLWLLRYKKPASYAGNVQVNSKNEYCNQSTVIQNMQNNAKTNALLKWHVEVAAHGIKVFVGAQGVELFVVMGLYHQVAGVRVAFINFM